MTPLVHLRPMSLREMGTLQFASRLPPRMLKCSAPGEGMELPEESVSVGRKLKHPVTTAETPLPPARNEIRGKIGPNAGSGFTHPSSAEPSSDPWSGS